MSGFCGVNTAEEDAKPLKIKSARSQDAVASAESPRCDREEAGSIYQNGQVNTGRCRRYLGKAKTRGDEGCRRARVICRRYLLSGDAPGFLTEKASVCAVAARSGGASPVMISKASGPKPTFSERTKIRIRLKLRCASCLSNYDQTKQHVSGTLTHRRSASRNVGPALTAKRQNSLHCLMALIRVLGPAAAEICCPILCRQSQAVPRTD